MGLQQNRWGGTDSECASAPPIRGSGNRVVIGRCGPPLHDSRHTAAFCRLEAPPCRADRGEKGASCGVVRYRYGCLDSPFAGATAGCNSRALSNTSSGTGVSSRNRSVKHAVEWGLAYRDRSGIGVDEIQRRSGHTSRRGGPDEVGRLRADPDEVPLVPAQAATRRFY